MSEPYFEVTIDEFSEPEKHRARAMLVDVHDLAAGVVQARGELVIKDKYGLAPRIERRTP